MVWISELLRCRIKVIVKPGAERNGLQRNECYSFISAGCSEYIEVAVRVRPAAKRKDREWTSLRVRSEEMPSWHLVKHLFTHEIINMLIIKLSIFIGGEKIRFLFLVLHLWCWLLNYFIFKQKKNYNLFKIGWMSNKTLYLKKFKPNFRLSCWNISSLYFLFFFWEQSFLEYFTLRFSFYSVFPPTWSALQQNWICPFCCRCGKQEMEGDLHLKQANSSTLAQTLDSTA